MRQPGIEPGYPASNRSVLPLNHCRCVVMVRILQLRLMECACYFAPPSLLSPVPPPPLPQTRNYTSAHTAWHKHRPTFCLKGHYVIDVIMVTIAWALFVTGLFYGGEGGGALVTVGNDGKLQWCCLKTHPPAPPHGSYNPFRSICGKMLQCPRPFTF